MKRFLFAVAFLFITSVAYAWPSGFIQCITSSSTGGESCSGNLGNTDVTDVDRAGGNCVCTTFTATCTGTLTSFHSRIVSNGCGGGEFTVNLWADNGSGAPATGTPIATVAATCDVSLPQTTTVSWSVVNGTVYHACTCGNTSNGNNYYSTNVANNSHHGTAANYAAPSVASWTSLGSNRVYELYIAY